MIEHSIEKKLFIFLLILLLIGALTFLTVGLALNKEFIAKYSPDNALSETTLQKMNTFRAVSFVLNVGLLALCLLVLAANQNIIRFIGQHKNAIIGLCILVITLVLLVIIAELALRAVYYEHTTRDGASPGNVKFNKRYFVLNNEFMRDSNFTLSKPANTTRFIGLGDSFTAGWGVKNVSDTYLNLLEEKLSTTNAEVEFYNFGVGGYGTDDEIRVLKEKALRYNPDAVLVGYMLNDFKNVDPAVKEPSSMRFTLPLVGFWLRTSSYFYYFVESRTNTILFALTADKTHEQYMREALASDLNRAYNAAYFAEMKNISAQENLPFFIVVFPIFQGVSHYSFSQIHEFIVSSAEENNLPVLDLLPFYTNYTDDELIVSRDDPHPNGFAHAIAAEAIKNFIESSDFLSSE